jgi:DNA-binding transcriptional LysR family regulator
MNRLELLRVFSVAAQTGSFRQAALKLAVSPQVVTRAITQLEEVWGELLFHRTSRQVRLTAFGERMADTARDAVLGVDQVFEKDTRPGRNTSMGVVRVAVPGSLGRRCVAEVLVPLMTKHPGLDLDLRVSDQIADAVNEKIDVGARIGRLRDSRFVARKVADLPFVVVATPALVRRTFEPDTIEEMVELPITALIDRNTGRPWPWVFRAGQQFVPNSAVFVTDDPETESAAVLAGVGFGQLPMHLAMAPLQAGLLVAVLEHEAPEPWPVVVYRTRRTPTPPRVRLVFDQLVESLADQRWLPTQL